MRGFYEQTRKSDSVRLVFLSRLQNSVDRLLNSKIDNLVSVIGKDDVDEVFPDVMNIPLDRREHNLPPLGTLFFFHEPLEIGYRPLHNFRGTKHKRKLHFSGAKILSDYFHPCQKNLVDNFEWPVFFQGLVQSRFKPVFHPINHKRLQPVFNRPFRQFRFPGWFPRLLLFRTEPGFKMLYENFERIPLIHPPVIDKIF
ncbi:MAG: hypothetical protein BWY44_00763 [Candidatus Omnitrophica bacterium ADurb.Bin292]|nr:MAG: hypothetical protein BWY44_00763 [Candidatus Omnitrophica bacterium ADurb.Bin292]